MIGPAMLLGALDTHPGSTVAELMNLTGMGKDHTRKTLENYARRGHVDRDVVDGRGVLYWLCSRPQPRSDLRVLDAIRIARDGITHRQLMSRVNLGSSSVNAAVIGLQRAGKVTVLPNLRPLRYVTL